MQIWLRETVEQDARIVEFVSCRKLSLPRRAAALALATLLGQVVLGSLAQTIVLRNWGGVRITQENESIQIVITTENQTRIAGIAVNEPDPHWYNLPVQPLEEITL